MRSQAVSRLPPGLREQRRQVPLILVLRRGCRQSLVHECLHYDDLKYGLEVALIGLRLIQHVCKM